MHQEPASFASRDAPAPSGLAEAGFHRLRRRLVDLVEPLSDEQLLALADGIHEMLRQRRAVRSHHRQRMSERAGGRFDLSV